MNKNLKGLLAVTVVLLLAGGVYLLTHKKKNAYARYIAKSIGASYIKLLTFDEEYLHQWMKGIKKNMESFSYNNENYDVSTGKKITV